MPRKGTVERRETGPDPVYVNPLVQKLVNCVMIQGKESVAQNIVYDAFELIKERKSASPAKAFQEGGSHPTYSSSPAIPLRISIRLWIP